MREVGIQRRTVLQLGVGALAALSVPACSSDDTDSEAADVEPNPDPNGGQMPAPVSMVRTSWAADPWALGSYSYLPVGATPQARLDLAAPVDGQLFFAGEALATFHPSTVHGAQQSGLAAAARVDEELDAPAVIVVVGAGIAGAAAARALTDAGHEVVVVEARDRVGGRLHSSRPEGWPIPVERGASWVHDTAASDLADQLTELEVAVAPFEYESAVLGNDAEDDAAAEAVQAAIDWAEELDTDVSLAEALQQSGAAAEVEAGALQHFLRTELSTEYGADATELSAWWGTAEGSEGDDVLVLGGYDALVTSQLAGLDVRLGWAAATIDRTGEQVVVSSADDAVTADAVIVTVPIGVLQAEVIDFQPPLPATHLAAIEALGMGLLDKVWLRWEEPWWSTTAQQWTRLATSPDDSFLEWFNLFDVAGAPVLLGLIGGAEAREWSNTPDDDVLAAAAASLQHFHDAGW